MRSLVFLAALLLITGGKSASCFAQQTRPRTLENLLNSDDAQKPPTADADAVEADTPNAAPKRPAGSVARPKDGVKHPDLDKAWAKYDAVVGRVALEIRTAINQQFDAVTAKGDLDAAEKWQNVLEKFEKAGELPAETETKAAVAAAAIEYKKARQELDIAYDSTVRLLTTDRKISEAKAARNEANTLSEMATNRYRQQETRISLLDIRPVFAFCAWGGFTRNKPADKKPVIRGKECNEFLLAHATSVAQFPVPPNARRLQAIGASTSGSKSMRFIVMTPEGHVLQESMPLDRCKDGVAELDVAVPAGLKAVNLIVDSCGDTNYDHAVWCFPTFVLE